MGAPREIVKTAKIIGIQFMRQRQHAQSIEFCHQLVIDKKGQPLGLL
jgi:hypothetical protein